MSNRSTATAVRTRHVHVLTLFAILAGGTGTLADEKAAANKPSVTACGLRVIAPQEGNRIVSLLGGTPGTALALEVECSAGELIAFEREASKLKSFTDNLGTTLDSETIMGASCFTGVHSISEDGRRAYIEIQGGGLPDPKARVLRATGTIVLWQGSDFVKEKLDQIPLKKDTAFKIGKTQLRIAVIEKPRWSDGEVAVTFEAQERLDFIKSIRFLDSEGKEIESSKAGSTMTRINKDLKVSHIYHLERKTDTLMLEVEYCKDLHEIKIPFNVETGIGLK